MLDRWADPKRVALSQDTRKQHRVQKSSSTKGVGYKGIDSLVQGFGLPKLLSYLFH